MCDQYIWMDCANGNKQSPMVCSPLCSWPGHLYHQIPVGHGQVPHQTVAEKHLWDHLQGIPTLAKLFLPLLLKVILSLIEHMASSTDQIFRNKRSRQPPARSLNPHTSVICFTILFFFALAASNSDRQWSEGSGLSLQQPEGEPAEPGEEERVSRWNDHRWRVRAAAIKHALPLSSIRGSLLTRSLADIVKKEDFVLDSEYLITMLVVVPK